MSDIQRYALQTELSEDSLGKWVRYEDHLDEVAWAVSEVLDAARDAVVAAYDDPAPMRDGMTMREEIAEMYGRKVMFEDALDAIDTLREEAR